MFDRLDRDDPDKDLCYLVQKGDHSSFASLFSKYHGKVYVFILKYIHSPELTKDLTQEVFIKIWENRSQLDEVRSFRAFLFTVARNHTFNTLKKMASVENAQSYLLTFFDHNREMVHDEYIYNEYMEQLNKVLESLPPRTRDVFRLCRQEGKSYEEAAEALGISRNAIKNHMVYSMKILGDFAEKDLQIPLNILLTVFFPCAVAHTW